MTQNKIREGGTVRGKKGVGMRVPGLHVNVVQCSIHGWVRIGEDGKEKNRIVEEGQP